MQSSQHFADVPVVGLSARFSRPSLYSIKIVPNEYDWTDHRSLFVSQPSTRKTGNPSWIDPSLGVYKFRIVPGYSGISVYILEHSSSWLGSTSAPSRPLGRGIAPITCLLNETSAQITIYEMTVGNYQPAQVGTVTLVVGEPIVTFRPTNIHAGADTFLRTFGELTNIIDGMRTFHISGIPHYRLARAIGGLTSSFLLFDAHSKSYFPTNNPCQDLLSQASLLARYVYNHYQQSPMTRQLAPDCIGVLARALAIMFGLATYFTNMTYRKLRGNPLEAEVQQCQNTFLHLYANMVRDSWRGVPPFASRLDEDLCSRAVEDFMRQSKETRLSGPYVTILEIVRGSSARSLQDIFKNMIEHSVRTPDGQGPARRDACRQLISFIARTAIVLPSSFIISTPVTKIRQAATSSLPNADGEEDKSDFNLPDDSGRKYPEYPRGVVSSVKYSQKSAVKSGSQGQVYKGEMATGQQERKVTVAIKVIHGNVKRDNLQQVYLEIVLAMTMHHPRIIRMEGIVDSPEGLKLIFPWYGNGDSLTYLWTLYEQGGRKRFVRKINQLLHQVAEGLAYMQGEMVVHGDLSSRNILVDNEGNAVVADLGLATYMNSLSKQNQSSRADNTRWLAPELSETSRRSNGKLTTGRPTPQSDLFAFAMVCIELYSGHPPFRHELNQAVVHQMLRNKERPKWPPLLQDQNMQNVIRRCWDADPNRRGTAIDLVRDMEYICRYC